MIVSRDIAGKRGRKTKEWPRAIYVIAQCSAGTRGILAGKLLVTQGGSKRGGALGGGGGLYERGVLGELPTLVVFSNVEGAGTLGFVLYRALSILEFNGLNKRTKRKEKHPDMCKAWGGGLWGHVGLQSGAWYVLHNGVKPWNRWDVIPGSGSLSFRSSGGGGRRPACCSRVTETARSSFLWNSWEG